MPNQHSILEFLVYIYKLTVVVLPIQFNNLAFQGISQSHVIRMKVGNWKILGKLSKEVAI